VFCGVGFINFVGVEKASPTGEALFLPPQESGAVSVEEDRSAYAASGGMAVFERAVPDFIELSSEPFSCRLRKALITLVNSWRGAINICRP
jgi:hypothetical protein